MPESEEKAAKKEVLFEKHLFFGYVYAAGSSGTTRMGGVSSSGVVVSAGGVDGSAGVSAPGSAGMSAPPPAGAAGSVTGRAGPFRMTLFRAL